MKRYLKWLGLIGGALLGLLVLVLVGIWLVSASRLNRTYEVGASLSLDVPSDASSIAEGRRLYAIMCTECHGENLAGKELANDAMLGQIHSANLTAGTGGIGQTYTDEDLARAIWYGVKTDGSPVVVMPVEYNRLQVADMEKLLAYIGSVPPVDSPLAVIRPGVFLRVLHAFNLAPLVPAESIDMTASPPNAVDPTDILAYGEYITLNCSGCHGADFTGGELGEPSLIPALSTWTEAEFTRAVREGERPDGTTLNSEEMPWPAFRNFTDEEMHAIWAYLQNVEAVARVE